MSSSQSQNEIKFTPKEQEQVVAFQETINSRAASKLEKEIAQAQLDALVRSKEPAPHVHKHRVREPEEGERGGTEHNMFHNDEAFERYAMGGHSPPGPHKKWESQAEKDYKSVRMNHKARGVTKEKAERESSGSPPLQYP